MYKKIKMLNSYKMKQKNRYTIKSKIRKPMSLNRKNSKL